MDHVLLLLTHLSHQPSGNVSIIWGRLPLRARQLRLGRKKSVRSAPEALLHHRILRDLQVTTRSRRVSSRYLPNLLSQQMKLLQQAPKLLLSPHSTVNPDLEREAPGAVALLPPSVETLTLVVRPPSRQLTNSPTTLPNPLVESNPNLQQLQPLQRQCLLRTRHPLTKPLELLLVLVQLPSALSIHPRQSAQARNANVRRRSKLPLTSTSHPQHSKVDHITSLLAGISPAPQPRS